MTALELASNQIFGGDTEIELPEPAGGINPRQALEQSILHPLTRPPCVVAFSGGRDSSAILAVATHVARREGLALPIPVTLRFTDDPGTEESDWQELVIRHLGLPDWERPEIGNDLDLVGPVATDLLRRHGPVYPPQAHLAIPLLRTAAGGTLLSGEGGDDLFLRRRAARLRLRNRSPSDSLWRATARIVFELAPSSMRSAVLRRRYTGSHHSDRWRWLRPGARSAVLAHWIQGTVAEPLRFDRFVEWQARARELAVWRTTFDVLASEARAQVADPLLDPKFLAALAFAGGRGPGDRTSAMHWLFEDVLPDPVLERQSKAEFTGAFFGEASRAFVREWNGSGIDASLVDAIVLRDVWSCPRPDSGTFSLLQSAWLNQERSRNGT